MSVLLLCILPGVLSADVNISLRLEHPAVLRHEKLNVFLTIENDTDHLLVINHKDAGKGTAMRLDFDVYMKRDQNMLRVNSSPIVSELNMIPGDKRVFMIDITKFYRIPKDGRYIIGAVLRGNKKTLRSNKESLDIVPGIELASIIKEVPGYESEMRKISVRYWNRYRKEVLFLSVDDTKNEINYGVFQLGRLLRITKPSIKYERSGHFTVRHQCRGDCYVLSSFLLKQNSVMTISQKYVTRDGKPYTMAESSKGRLIEELKKRKPDSKK